MLLFQASPIYPPDEFRKIVHCPELDEFVATESDSILHVQCDSDTSATFQYINDFLKTSEKNRRRVLYFQFNSRDVRFNNISSMITTFIAQLAFASLGFLTANHMLSLSWLLAYKAWNPGSLYRCWDDIRGMLSDYDIFYVLNDFDECDESGRWFLERVKSCMKRTESRFKIVIFSKTRASKAVRSVSSGLPIDSYREISVGSNTLLKPIAAGGINFDFEMLLQERPQYLTCESRIQTLMRASPGDFKTCRVFVQWLRSTRRPFSAIEADLDKFTPFTPATVCVTILEAVPRERQNWARILISWVLVAVRPLRVTEFCVVSNMALGLMGKTGNEPTSRFPNLQSDLDKIQSRLAGNFCCGSR